MRVSRVFLFATLSQHAKKKLQTMINIDASTRRKVATSSERANIHYRVMTMNKKYHVAIIKNLLKKQQDRHQKTLINVLTKIEDQQLSDVLQLSFYESNLNETNKTKMIEEFMREKLASIIATTTIDTEIDLIEVSLMILISEDYELITIMQQS